MPPTARAGAVPAADHPARRVRRESASVFVAMYYMASIPWRIAFLGSRFVGRAAQRHAESSQSRRCSWCFSCDGGQPWVITWFACEYVLDVFLWVETYFRLLRFSYSQLGARVRTHACPPHTRAGVAGLG
jgi:hypothetical protein